MAPPTSTTASSPSSSSAASATPTHKIHELQERALKSPIANRTSTPSLRTSTPQPIMSTSSSLGGVASARKDTPSPSSSANQRREARSRSPPPLRHVHTHTHTHFGLGYPILPPGVAGSTGLPGVSAPPAAHTPFPPGGFPGKQTNSPL